MRRSYIEGICSFVDEVRFSCQGIKVIERAKYMDFQTAFNELHIYGQEHLLKYYDELSQKQQEVLLKQIENIDWKLFDLLKQHNDSKKLGRIEPPKALELEDINCESNKFEEIGFDAIRSGKVGAVLLAGGQGTRLGFDRPKGTLNVGITKELYLFEILINNLMEVTRKAGVWVPFYIMTSDRNNKETIEFFEVHNYFGYPSEYITFFIQEMAPSVDFDGKILMEGPGTLSLSPNGNGGWFSSMKKCGLLKDLHKKGIEWLNIFSVDNVLQKIADPLFVGATLHSGCVSGAKAVKKANPDERVGVLCLEDGRPSIVEYYEMTEEMRNSKREDGELLYNFGVTLNYLFNVNNLEKILNGHMPVHIVKKKIPYIDEEGTLVQPETENGYKFETLALDMIHLLDNCLAYEIERKLEFAPIKNKTGVDSLESARALMLELGMEL